MNFKIGRNSGETGRGNSCSEVTNWWVSSFLEKNGISQKRFLLFSFSRSAPNIATSHIFEQYRRFGVGGVDVVGNNLGGNEGILGYWGSGCHYLEPAN